MKEKIINIIFPILLISALVIVIFNNSSQLFNRYIENGNSLKLELVEKKDLDFDLTNDNWMGSCYSETMQMGVHVYVVNKIPDNVEGQFYQNEYSIVLVKTSINTIAHEVSHFVDFSMKQKNIKDSETKAYLQGYFTECVDNKVN